MTSPDRKSMDAPYDAPPPPPSPLRWLLVVVPIVVLVAAGWHLATVVATGIEEAGGSLWPAPAEPEQEQGSRSSEAPRFPFPPFGPGPDDKRKPVAGEVSDRPSGPAAGEGFDVADVGRRLATADARSGETAARMCAPCHPVQKGEWHRVGPSLWGVVGRAKASAPGYAFSQALRARGGTWTVEELAAFLHNPRTAVPGTQMTFGGISDPARVADLIAYLATLADAPKPLPAVPR
jgi:cytochrome c